MTWVRSEKIFFTCPSRLVSLAIFFSLSLLCFGCSLCCLHCLCVSDRGAGFLLFCCCWSLIKSRLLLLPFFVVSITKLIKLLLFSRSLFFFPGWSLESYLLRASWLGFLSCLEASTLEAVFCFISFSFFPICRSVKAAVRERERASEFFLQNSSFLSPTSVRHSELSFFFFFAFLQVFGELAGSVIQVCCSTTAVFWDLITVRFRECCCRCCYFCFVCYLCLRCFSLWSAIVCFPHSFIRYSAKFQALWISLI